MLDSDPSTNFFGIPKLLSYLWLYTSYYLNKQSPVKDTREQVCCIAGVLHFLVRDFS